MQWDRILSTYGDATEQNSGLFIGNLILFNQLYWRPVVFSWIRMRIVKSECEINDHLNSLNKFKTIWNLK